MAVGAYRGEVYFSVLGPVRVTGSAGPVEIRGVKERLLLGMLIAHAGRAVPVAALVDALWGQEPPRTAGKSLQTYVLRLRNALEPDRHGEPTLVVTDGHGYRLVVDPGQVDAGHFESMVLAVEHARPRERAVLLREALDLWRGNAYADLDSAPALSAEATRLEELRLTARAERIAAELELGRHRAAVPELERLTTEHPLRERWWSLLMLALYRDGRQADALVAYDRARAVLAEELGIDPGEELRALHARVLAQDPGLLRTGSREVPRPLASPERVMHGRDRELDLLRDEWRRSTEGRRIVVVRAPVGGGARRLAIALAEDVADHGSPVVHVGPAGQEPPGAMPDGPLLMVQDRVEAASMPARGLVLRLAGPGAATDDADTVIDLAPLDAAAVRALVAEHVTGRELDVVAAEVHAQSGGWPARVHAATRSYLREVAKASVSVAADDTESSFAHLRDARERLAAGVLDLRGDAGPATDPDLCPWPGLEPYGVEDGPRFAGRERLVAELVSRVAGASFLAVVGASGSGKSSVVRAGLLAALADDALPGSAGWTVLVMRPGRHPLRELAHAVLGARRPDVGAILERLARGDDATEQTVLLVDQFEELWTSSDDDGEREAFLDTLAELAADPQAGATVVVVLRADYLDRLADHPGLAGLIGDHTVLVGVPSTDDVRRAVERPAQAAGLDFDIGLAEAVVEDAGAEPGLLPLLSTSLAQLWERREGNRLTFAGYVASGGLRGAVGHLAEQAYADLEADQQVAARALLLRLTGPGDGTAVTRRRVPTEELATLPADHTRAVIERLTRARLLTSSDGYVEVAHEALFREWPRLRVWLTEDVAGRAVQRRLAVAATEWESEARDPALLWRGARLEAGAEVAAARPSEVTVVERTFLDAATEAADAERREAVRRAEDKARQNRRLRTALTATAGLLALAVIAGVVALLARNQAGEAADEAEAAAVAADAKRLAASALSIEYPDLALLAAVESTRLEESPETYGALLTLLSRQPDVVTRYRTPDRFLFNASSPDGRTVFVSENSNVLRALDARTGEQLWVSDLPGGIGAVAPSPDGDAVAVGTYGGDNTAIGISLLDPADGHELHRLPFTRVIDFVGPELRGGLWYGGGWTRDHRLVFATESHVLVSDRQGRMLAAVEWPRPVFDTESLRVWPDGHVSTGPSEVGPGVVIDLAAPAAPGRTTGGMVLGVSPDGTRLVEVREDERGSSVRVLDARSLEPRSERWPVEGTVRSAVFSPDSSRFALAVEEEVLVRDAQSAGPVATLRGHSGTVVASTYAGPRHDLIWTAGRDGLAVAFDETGERGLIKTTPTNDSPHAGEGAAESATAIWTDYNDYGANRAFLRLPGDARGRTLPLTGLEDCLCQATSTDLSRDGSLALVGMQVFDEDIMPVVDRGHVVVWDAPTRTLRRVVDTPWPVTGVGLTPDGSRAVVNGSAGWGVLDLGTLELTTVSDDDLGFELPHGTSTVEVSPDGRRAALLRGSRLVLVDTASGDALDEAVPEPGSGLMATAWTRDGRQLVVGSDDGRLVFLDSGTLTTVAPNRLITGGFVIDVETSPDGRVLASIGDNGDVTLWDVATWRPYGQPVVDDLGWGFLSFDPETSSLRVEFEAGRRVTVGTRLDDWVDAACAAANRDLTAEETAIIRPGLEPRPTCVG